MVLAYPPATHVDARLMPAEGPRRPLVLRSDGSYQVENPLTGRTLHFPSWLKKRAMAEWIGWHFWKRWK